MWCAQAKRRVYTLQRASGDKAKAKRKRQGPGVDGSASASGGQQQKDAVEAVPVLEEMPKWQQVQVILQVSPENRPDSAASSGVSWLGGWAHATCMLFWAAHIS